MSLKSETGIERRIQIKRKTNKETYIGFQAAGDKTDRQAAAT